MTGLTATKDQRAPDQAKMIRFRCRGCKAKGAVPQKFAGRRFRCKGCGASPYQAVFERSSQLKAKFWESPFFLLPLGQWLLVILVTLLCS